MRARSRRIAATLVVASTVASLVLSAGCLWTSHAEGKKLRALTGEHDQRLTKLEAGLRTERETLHAAVGSAQLKVQQLEEVLERATAVVTRNSADTGALVQELQTQIASLEGQIAELRNTNEQLTRQLSTQRSEMDERITQIARKAGIDMPLPSAEIPADRVEHFAAARRAHQASDYSRARALFREYLSRYAGDGERRRVSAEHAAGDASDDALLDMGDAFYRLHACTDARTTLEALVRTQPSSPLVSRAREKLREIQRAPRGHCTS
jgi:TolA-binding protein